MKNSININRAEWVKYFASLSHAELNEEKKSLEQTLRGRLGPHVREMVDTKLTLCTNQLKKANVTTNN